MRWLLLLLLMAARSRGAGQPAGRARARRRPAGPEVEPVRGHWSSLPRSERLRAYALDLQAAYTRAGLPAVAVPLAVAHSMFATGAWRPDGPRVWNNNIAVARAGPTWRGPWAALSTREVVDDRGTVDPSDDVVRTERGAAWRVYPTLDAGAAAAVRIWAQPRYRAAYRALLAGDPSWSRLLGVAGYYSGNPILFERLYRNRLQRVRALLA